MVFQKAISRLQTLASRKAEKHQKRVMYQQKPKQQEGNMRRYNLMWTPKELRSNRLTPLNKDTEKRTFQGIRRGSRTRRCSTVSTKNLKVCRLK